MTDGAGAAFGHAMRAAWPLDPAVLYLNHGTVGATPRVVMAEQQRILPAVGARPAILTPVCTR